MPAKVAPARSTAFAARRMRLWSALLLYGIVSAWGALQVVSPGSAAAYILSALLIASTATTWAVYDAQVREFYVPGIVWKLYFVTWPFASFLYLIWTRGVAGLGYWLVNAMGMVFTVCVTLYLAFYLRYSLDRILGDYSSTQ